MQTNPRTILQVTKSALIPVTALKRVAKAARMYNRPDSMKIRMTRFNTLLLVELKELAFLSTLQMRYIMMAEGMRINIPQSH
jgi:hypothetical protein